MSSALLIYPEPEEVKKTRFGYSINMLYIGAIIEQAGHVVVKYLDYSINTYTDDPIEKYITICDYIIVEIDAYALKRSINLQNAMMIIASTKQKYPNKIVIAFGYDISIMPREVKYADYTLSYFELEKEIVNIISRKTGSLIQPAQNRSFDKLPYPDRTLISEFNTHGGTKTHLPNLAKSTLLQTSRGCGNTCTFCQRKGWYNQRLQHSIGYIHREMKLLKEEQFVNIWIVDDNFTFNLANAKQILEMFIKEELTTRMKIACSSWSKIDYEFLDLAKRANVSVISMGVESANKEILDFYNKENQLDRLSSIIKHADEIGLYTIANVIIGAPMETERTINNTLEYVLQTPFDQVNIKVLDYMAGSKLFQELPASMRKGKRHLFACKENGLCNFTLEELKEFIHLFQERIHKEKHPKLLSKILKNGTPYNLAPIKKNNTD